MDTDEMVTPTAEARPVDEMEVIYLELLADGTFDRLEEMEEADWVALAEEEHIGQHLGQYPFLY